MPRTSRHTIYATREWYSGDEQTGEVDLKITYTYYPGTDDTWTDPGDPEEFDTITIEEPDGEGGWTSVNYFGSATLPTGQKVIDEYDDWVRENLTDEMRQEAHDDQGDY